MDSLTQPGRGRWLRFLESWLVIALAIAAMALFMYATADLNVESQRKLGHFWGGSH
ncbi:MAG: hypothetical protein AB7S98_14250 [Burkholderiaceae bacterium]